MSELPAFVIWSKATQENVNNHTLYFEQGYFKGRVHKT